MTDVPEPRTLLVIYDADCGICTRTARVLRRLDQRHRLRFVAAQDSTESVDRPPVDALLRAIHVRDAAGRWHVAGRGAIRIADAIPVLKPLALLARLPLAMRLVEWGYGRIAANRGRISRVLREPACQVASGPPRASVGGAIDRQHHPRESGR